MELFYFAIGLVILVLAAIFIFGKDAMSKARTLVRGFFGLFIEDIAKTPEGAAAIYNEALNKKQEAYNVANNTLQKVAGQLETEKEAVKEYKQKLKDVETKCENFVKAGKFDEAQLFAQQRSDILLEIETHERAVAELTPILEEAKVINNHLEQELTKLKRDKVRVINELKLNKNIKSMYDDMNKLKNVTGTDKLLDAVREGAKDTKEHAVGAKVVHNNRISTKIQNADLEAKKLQGDSYLEDLKKKHNVK